MKLMQKDIEVVMTITSKEIRNYGNVKVKQVILLNQELSPLN